MGGPVAAPACVILSLDTVALWQTRLFGERPPRPPEVQRAGMAMSDGLLPRRRLVDGLQRQGDLDQLLAVELRHAVASLSCLECGRVSGRIGVCAGFSAAIRRRATI